MKKTIAFILLIVSLALLITSSSSYLMEKVDEYIPNPYRYGDLYLYSNIKKFKLKNERCPRFTREHPDLNEVNLYVLGDSYTRLITPDNFHVNRFQYLPWSKEKQSILPLDTNKTNVLVIECVERYFRERFTTNMANSVYIADSNVGNDQPTVETEAASFEIEKYLKWKAEDNLDYLLDYTDVALFFKEIKAGINYKLFDKLDARVSIPPGEKYIFYRETTDSMVTTSSFCHLTESEVDTMIFQLHEAFKYYKGLGFDKVCLAIVPNAVSINAPEYGRYNHLVERIQNHPGISVPIIDIYSEMKRDTINFFCINDGHWNCKGKNIFLNGVHDYCEK